MTQLLQGQPGAQGRPHPVYLLVMEYLSSALAGWEPASLAVSGAEARVQDISVTVTL